MTDLINIF